ncbi:MAG TPA: S41 family peptidase [Candidatus Solibacter sp.]|nr:S41 family peptidase [Candidatus Solibacter sp.]
MAADQVDDSGELSPGLPPQGPRGGAGRWVKRVIYVLALPLAFYLGVLTQFHLGPDFDPNISGLLFSQPTTSLDSRTLNEIWQTMQRDYANPKLSGSDAFDAAAKGLVHLLLSGKYADDFSAYYTPQELKRNQDFLAGNFGGIGATMAAKDGKLIISKVLPKTPAEQAGLQQNDVVTTIDGAGTNGLSVDEAVAKIRGTIGTHVRLGVLRGGVVKEFDIVRANINVPSVESRDLAGGVLYVRIFDFGAHTADDFRTSLNQGFAHGDKKVLLDLRENPGGFVTAANSVVSEFVKSGISVSIVGRDGKHDDQKVSGNGVAFTEPLVVLIDGQTASAAEIVAGALKDSHRAKLVGDRSFGKGSVQDDFPISNGGDLHLTVAHWFTPSGHSIQKNPSDPNSGGITPDRALGLDKPEHFYNVDDPASNPALDNQLQAARALLG